MKNKKKADLILIICLLLISCILFCVRTATRQSGAVAAVYVDGVREAEYSLSEELTVHITFDVNGAVSELVETLDAGSDNHVSFGFNILEIHDGCASVTEADCPDKICVESHKIRYNGESITCLPHRLQIVIEGGEGGVDL